MVVSIYMFSVGVKASYPGFVCYVCFKTISESSLQRCSGCKLIFYCCKEHQKFHWPRHKQFCQVIKSLEKPVGDYVAEAFGLEEFFREVHFNVLTKLCEDKIKRSLTQDEYIMLCNPFLCRVCHIYSGKQMITCEECFTSAYCSLDHKNQDAARHSLTCSELKKILDYSKNLNGDHIIQVAIKNFIKLPYDMKSFIDKIDIVKTEPRAKEVYVKYLLMELFTIPLTVIYAIEKSLSGNKMKKKYLTIHVVNCKLYENSAAPTWQYIFHHFKVLKSINLIFIGPKISSDCFCVPILYCKECINSGKIINFTMESMKYHEYLIKKPTEKPDIIICFHCGFYDCKCSMKNEIWKDSMQSLCSFPGTTVAFTSYNENEAKEDLKIFKESCGADKLKFLVESELNPYRSLLPKFAVKREKLSYHNCYITIAKS